MSEKPLFGPYGSTALVVIDRLLTYNANALWFHGFNPEAFEACQKYHIAPCVEFKTFRADFQERPDLVPIGVDGKPIRYGNLVQGVCLSKVDFLEETEANLLKGVQTYQPTGIWLDYLTYAGWFETPEPDLQESCFCPDCIADFCQATGLDMESPNQIMTIAAESWTAHKCRKIAGFAQHYANLIHTYLPDCIIGAYMCPWTPGEYQGALYRIFAQDYQLLAPAIDIFTPLIYCMKSGRSTDWGLQFLDASPDFIPSEKRVQLILDALDYPESLRAATKASKPTWGIQLFNGAQIFANPYHARQFAEAVELIL